MAYSSLSPLLWGTEPENIAKTDVKECTAYSFLLGSFMASGLTLKHLIHFEVAFVDGKKGFQVDSCVCSCQFSQYCSLKRLSSHHCE